MPVPPSSVSLMTPAGSVVAVTPSSPPEGVDDERIVGPLGAGDVRPGPAARPRRAEVPAPTTSMMSLPLVPLTMTVSAAPSPRRRRGRRRGSMLTLVTSVPVRSLTVIVSAPPRALRSTPSTSFEVHDDVADVAGEPQPAAVGRDVELLVDVRAVEQHACRCRPGPRRCRCRRRDPTGRCRRRRPRNAESLPRPPSMKSLPSPPSSMSSPSPPSDRVVAGAAVDGDLDQRGQAVAGR